MDFHTLLAAFSLVVALLSLAYVIHTNRRMRRDQAELDRAHILGFEKYIALQVQRWENGEIRSRSEIDVSGSSVDFIEPISGWIVVGTTR